MELVGIRQHSCDSADAAYSLKAIDEFRQWRVPLLDVDNRDGRVPADVTSADLRSTSSDVRPVADPPVLLTRVRAGGRVRLHAVARKGTGRAHAKWSPVCAPSYRVLDARRSVVDDAPRNFEMRVETCGSLTPARALAAALGVLEARVEACIDAVLKI